MNSHQDLWERYMSDRSIENRNALAQVYLPLMRQVTLSVWRTLPATVGEPEELYGLAFEGLVKAIERFDPERGFQFQTFSDRRIRGAIYDGLRNFDHVPRSARVREKKDGTPVRQLQSLQMLAGDEGDLADLDFLSYSDSEPADEFWTEACRGLSKTERLIVLLYYRCELKMRDIGKSLGISESRVCQLRSQIVAKIRAHAVGRRRALQEKS